MEDIAAENVDFEGTTTDNFEPRIVAWGVVVIHMNAAAAAAAAADIGFDSRCSQLRSVVGTAGLLGAAGLLGTAGLVDTAAVGIGDNGTVQSS